MTTWLFFSLLAPFLWSFSNVLDGTIRTHYVKNDMWITWMATITRLIFAIGFFFFATFTLYIPDTKNLLLMAAAGLLWTLPIFLYIRALSFEEPSRIALLTQLTPVWALVLAWMLLQETLTIGQAGAFFLLLVGGVIASVRRLENSFHFSRALFLILIACLCWALSDVLFKKIAPNFGEFNNAFFFYMLGSALPGPLVLLHPKLARQTIGLIKNIPKPAWWFILATSVMGIAGSNAFAYALTLGKASLTTVLMGVQPIFALLIGLLLKKFIPAVPAEDVSKRALTFKAISFLFIIAGLIYLQIH